ncbi:MAG TPA: hypothetical protein PKK66_07185 [Bacteroidales bacterium]|nr:hypothetical protein [Bacteroidales bacterium]HPT52973.1 hypothetical protein [Bacteroidales bacterium]
MKKLNVVLVAVMAALVMMTACKTAKQGPTTTYQKEESATEVVIPFSDKQYQTDKDNFRAKNSGKSPDMATAKKIALMNAKTELAAAIQSVIKSVTEQYTNQRSVADAQEYENKFEEIARMVVNQQLNDVRTIGEKLFKESDGKYTYWVAIEMPKDAVQKALCEKISADSKLQLDFDKHQFEKTFNEEMQKFEEGR